MDPLELFQIVSVVVICGVFLFSLTKYVVKTQKKIEEKEKTKEIPPAGDLAGFGIRAVAFVIDFFIFSCLLGLIVAVFGLEEPAALYLWTLILWCVYYTVLVIYFNNTIGKRILRLKIVSATAKPLTIGRILMRAFFLITFDWLIFGSGFLLILINKNKQGLHDKVAHTYVVRVN